MDKKQILIKLLAYSKASINAVSNSSQTEQNLWIEEVKKYYSSDFDPARLECLPNDPEGQSLWLKSVEHLSPLDKINLDLLKFNSNEYEYVESTILHFYIEMVLLFGKKEVSGLAIPIRKIIDQDIRAITFEQVLAHIFNQFLKDNNFLITK
jgi:hypothetical protein